MRCIIVDDEPLAQERVRSLLETEPDAHVVACCASGREAAAALAAHQTDVVFLDVQIPELDGLALARGLERGARPLVVFVTAYDAYAIDAFALGAVDYLMKPFSRERFTDTLQRVRRRLAGGHAADVQAIVRTLLEQREPSAQPAGQILVKSGERVRVVSVSGVQWVTSEGNYVRLHVTPGDTALVRGTLEQMLAQLGPAFARTHRTAAARVAAVRELRQRREGGYHAVLTDGTALPVGRKYRAAFEARLRSGH
jgi:two-component system, LytTR family, response regulator